MTNIKLLRVGDKLPVNEELAGLVPMASESEQAVLTEDIRKNGLREPIVLWKGKIVDGRCRQLACLASDRPIMAKELDDTLTEQEVRIFVKSVNTRRNLTPTQKIMSACRQSLDPSNSDSIRKVAMNWGISVGILTNARYIARNKPEMITPLFNGKSVSIIGSAGTKTTSVKVSAIYAYLKREEENVVEDTEYGWSENTFIKTQAGKDWYYEQVGIAKEVGDIKYQMLIAELANYKFKVEDK